MRKYYSLLLVVMSVLILTACGTKTTTQETTNGNGTTSNGGVTTEPVNDYWDKDKNGTPDWQEEEITLSYATWAHLDNELITLDSLLVEAFTEKYPNITVEMQIVSDGDNWDANFMSLLETGDLPDVFMIHRLESFLPYNILADITEMFENDPDTQYIFDSAVDSGIYNGKRYAIPTFVYPDIWFVNLDILEQAGINKPSYDWTVAQMEEIAKATKNENTHIIGLDGCNWYNSIYPKVLKGKDSGWAQLGYDGTSFNLSDPVFQTAFNAQQKAITEGYCETGLSTEELEEYYNDPSFMPRYGGKVALWTEPSWNAKNYFDQMSSFNWDAYAGPGGVTGGNIDIAGISSLTPHKEAAYQLLKWMNFGEDGLLKRFELYDPELYMSGNNYGYPIVDYGIDGQGHNKVWEAIPYGDTAPGLVAPEFIEGLKNGAFWKNKEVIGWDQVNGAINPYFVEISNGTNTYAALKETIQQTADQTFNQAKQAMEERLAQN